MIYPGHNRLIKFLFGNYIDFILKRHFHSIRLSGDIPEPGKSVLLIGNHFSWWDGFIAFYINKHFLKKRFYIMMLEEQLRKWRFFTGMGAFSIQPESRSVIDSLVFSGKILSDPANLLVMYPQGEIESLYKRDFHFNKGVIRIIKGVEGPLPGILFYAALIEYHSNSRPALYINLKKYDFKPETRIEDIEREYNEFYIELVS